MPIPINLCEALRLGTKFAGFWTTSRAYGPLTRKTLPSKSLSMSCASSEVRYPLD